MPDPARPDPNALARELLGLVTGSAARINLADVPQIAARLRAFAAAVREECAAKAEAMAYRNEEFCPSGCKCGDGYHVAAAIRKLGDADA